jgi:5'-deoxynucleotidase YfbR-like HD superfamily hydrolase
VAEHIGLLPLTATFLHPYLVNTVDLGKALIMLSIHDIGEIKVGDVLTVRDTKTEEHKHAERSAALSLLNPAHHALFTEFEAGVSNEAKFASAIDKITPNIYELIVDTDVARARHAHFGFDIHKAVAKDAPLLSWDGFLENFYREVIRKIEMRFN